METGIAKAIRLAGSQTALGNLLGLTPQAIQKWEAQGAVPGKRCREVEAKLNGQVTRYELNPDVFGDPPELAQSESESQ
jgi:DNA-binding transcriptional regulator YdaS (Cro superfamily)